MTYYPKAGGGAVGFEGPDNIQSLRTDHQLTTDNTKVGQTNLGSDTSGTLPAMSGNYATVTGGDQNDALADYATVAGGLSNHSIGLCAYAEGQGSLSAGNASHAEGVATFAYGDNGHSEGNGCTAFAPASHAEGQSSQASGWKSHAEGASTNAGYPAQTFTILAGGTLVTISGDVTAQFVFGDLVSVTPQTPVVLQSATFGHSVASVPSFGGVNTTFDLDSPIDGTTTGGLISDILIGFCAHAEGNSTQALGTASHAEGFVTHATGNYAHAEGEVSVANGEASHAEGVNNTASGLGAHAEGQFTQALVQGTHAEGLGSVASRIFQSSYATGNNASPLTSAESVQTSRLVFRGSTPGSVANESATLLFGSIGGTPTQTFTLEDAKVYIVSVELVARTTTGGIACRSLCRKASVRRDAGAVTVAGMNTLETLGDASLSAAGLTFTASGGDLSIVFNTGVATTAACTIVARVQFTETN